MNTKTAKEIPAITAREIVLKEKVRYVNEPQLR